MTLNQVFSKAANLGANQVDFFEGEIFFGYDGALNPITQDQYRQLRTSDMTVIVVTEEAGQITVRIRYEKPGVPSYEEIKRVIG